MRRIALALSLLAAPLHADPAGGFVESNLIATLYHELGHALIDVLALPVLGQEEDAADVASVILIDALFDEDSAVQIARDTAEVFLGYAETGDEPIWWGVHGPDLQRHYTLVCLFYGADPDTRGGFAQDFDLPQERADGCAEEFDLAHESWGPILDSIQTDEPGQSLVYQGKSTGPVETLVQAEVDALNTVIELPDPLTIMVRACGEANGYYDPQERGITLCSELYEEYRKLAP